MQHSNTFFVILKLFETYESGDITEDNLKLITHSFINKRTMSLTNMSPNINNIVNILRIVTDGMYHYDIKNTCKNEALVSLARSILELNNPYAIDAVIFILSTISYGSHLVRQIQHTTKYQPLWVYLRDELLISKKQKPRAIPPAAWLSLELMQRR